MSGAATAALKKLSRLKFTETERAALFAFIRTRSDAEIEATMAAPKPAAKPARRVDPLADDLAALMAPVLAKAGEKAHYIAAELGDPAPLPGGFAPAVRALAKRHGEAAVRAAARRFMESLAESHNPREPLP